MIIGIYGIQDIKLSEFPEFVHDHSIAVFQEGCCIHFMQLERFTGRKYDNRMPEFLYELLRAMKLAGHQSAEIIFTDNVLGRSFIAFKGDIRFEAPIIKKLASGHETGSLRWFGNEKEGNILNHELAHIYSCLPFFGTFRNNSLLLHFDGGASKGNFSAWHFKNNQIVLIEASWRFKYLSNFFNANALTFFLVGGTGKNQHAVPGKFMGLAAYGKYSVEMENWLSENNYFEDCWGNKKMFFDAVKNRWGVTLTEFDNRISVLQDIAATFQHIFERDFLEELWRLKIKYQIEYLYYTGGSALNIALNSGIVNSGIFADVFIPPCTNDSGLALGAAAYMDYLKNTKIRLHSPFLNNLGVPQEYTYTREVIVRVARSIHEGKIIGLCNGPSEIGPRALGNRSIICRADSVQLAQRLNLEIKKREWYRPVAPVMLEKNTRYFTGLTEIHHLSRYMLLEFFIPATCRDELEGAVHVNNTARIQTVFTKEESPFLFDLLHYLDKQYFIRALINTSFNVQGKPILHYMDEAKPAAVSMGLDGVVVNGRYSVIEHE